MTVTAARPLAVVEASEPRTPLAAGRLLRAKHAYTTRFVSERISREPDGFHLLRGQDLRPRPGDVVLAEVGVIGQHARLESPAGRRATLFEGDEVLLAYGNRYAPDQFEGRVPDDLGPLHLLAAGGIASRQVGAHSSMLPATEIHPVGLLADDRGVVNLADCAALRLSGAYAVAAPRPTAVAVLGTSMNSGKTTTAAAIIRGLAAAGLRVGAGKVTGTGAGGDPGLFVDSGAVRVLDFTDFGLPSTYLLDHDRVRDLVASALRELGNAGVDVIVIEVADGLYQRETSRLVADPDFRRWFDRCVFASGEALGAVAGHAHLTSLGLEVAAVGGLLTASPLAAREAAGALPVPVVDIEGLQQASVAGLLAPELLPVASS